MHSARAQQAGPFSLYSEAQAMDICDTVEYFFRKDPNPASRRVKTPEKPSVSPSQPADAGGATP